MKPIILQRPLLTIGKAITRAKTEVVGKILVAAGQYSENVTINSTSNLFGGYDNTFSELTRNWLTNISWIDGTGDIGLTIDQDITGIVEINGFKINNVNASNSTEYTAIKISSTSFIIKNNIITTGTNAGSITFALKIENVNGSGLISNNYIECGTAAAGNRAIAIKKSPGHIVIKSSVIISQDSVDTINLNLEVNSNPLVFGNTFIVNGIGNGRNIFAVTDSHPVIVNNVIFTKTLGLTSYLHRVALSVPFHAQPYYFQNNYLVNSKKYIVDDFPFGNTQYDLITQEADLEAIGINDVSGNIYTNCDGTCTLSDIFVGPAFNIAAAFKPKAGIAVIDAALSNYTYPDIGNISSFALQSMLTLDFDGNSRGFDDTGATNFDSGAFDIGAYEWRP